MSTFCRSLKRSSLILGIGVAGLIFSCSRKPAEDPDSSGQASVVGPSSSEGAAAEKTQLRVSLFPWVPDPESLFRWIEADFEAKHNEIDLVVRPYGRSLETIGDNPNPEYKGDLAYEVGRASVALLGTDSSDSHDLLEVDSVTLGALKAAIQPFGIDGPEFLPFAKEAAILDSVAYGVPHWTCGYFVIAENPAIRDATSLDALLKVLSRADNKMVDVAGDLDGSWDAVSLYLDAVRDADPGRDLRGELSKPELDRNVTSALEKLGKACLKDGKSYCGDDAVKLFASGQADSMIGYSERLNSLLKEKERSQKELHVASLPLGPSDSPTLFTDVLVLSRNCEGACKQAAIRFAAYYVSDKVFEHVLLNKDGTSGVRYLLPSTESAFRTGAVADDRLYRELHQEIQGARPFPNSGIPEARDAGTIRAEVKKLLGTAR
jgi:thiamine pyridinylase